MVLILKTYNKTRHETFMVVLYPHCRCLCNTLQNAEARNWAMPPRSLCPNEPNNGCGCSLMRRDIVEQFPGDICGESLGIPPHPSSPHTSPLHPPSLATAVVRALRREIKKRLLLSPCRRDGRLFLSSSFFSASLASHPQKGKWRGKREREKKKTTVWRKERKLYCVLWRSTTPPIPPPRPPPPAPSTAPPVERERAREERREGGQGHVIRRACGHSFTPRQNERGPAVSLLHD